MGGRCSSLEDRACDVGKGQTFSAQKATHSASPSETLCSPSLNMTKELKYSENLQHVWVATRLWVGSERGSTPTEASAQVSQRVVHCVALHAAGQYIASELTSSLEAEQDAQTYAISPPAYPSMMMAITAMRSNFGCAYLSQERSCNRSPTTSDSIVHGWVSRTRGWHMCPLWKPLARVHQAPHTAHSSQ